jgi:hypothetical protein
MEKIAWAFVFRSICFRKMSEFPNILIPCHHISVNTLPQTENGNFRLFAANKE